MKITFGSMLAKDLDSTPNILFVVPFSLRYKGKLGVIITPEWGSI